MKTLTHYITTATPLSDTQADAFVKVFGARCRENTKRRLRSIVRYSLSSLSGYGIFSRIQITETSVEYCAGQSYPDEVRTVRELILKG